MHGTRINIMNKLIILTGSAVSAMVLLSGCLALQVGGGDKKEVETATVGQQLVDLKKAKEAGAITEAEYEVQKEKLLRSK